LFDFFTCCFGTVGGSVGLGGGVGTGVGGVIGFLAAITNCSTWPPRYLLGIVKNIGASLIGAGGWVSFFVLEAK